VSVKVMKRRHHPDVKAINYMLRRYGSDGQCELDL
jgi:hypothetical protein